MKAGQDTASSAYVSIRQRMKTYVSIAQAKAGQDTAYVSIRQHTYADVC
jgi:hypothetical protein